MRDLGQILNKATEIAERAGELTMSYFRQAILIETKENGTPVTVADKKTEEFIRKEIAKNFPTHGILGEEFGEEGALSDFVWTVDPIDGTRSFIRGIPLFGTLLALLYKKEPILGVTVLPALGETYKAAKGLGLFCNNQPIRVAGGKALENAFISIGDVSCFEQAGKSNFLQSLMKRSGLIRGYTDCFGHCLVFRGSLDAMIDPVVSVWDVAPLACQIIEAGGDFCNFEGHKDIFSSSFMTYIPSLKTDLLTL